MSVQVHASALLSHAHKWLCKRGGTEKYLLATEPDTSVLMQTKGKWHRPKTYWKLVSTRIEKQEEANSWWLLLSSSSSCIFHGVGPLVDPFRSHYPKVSSKVYHDSFCQLGSSISLLRVIYFEAFYLHVVSSFPCIPVICPKLVLF